MNNKLKRHGAIFLVVLLIGGCVGNTQPTRYFTLTAQNKVAALEPGLPENISLGVGPLVLPEILERSGIVSYKRDNELAVSSYHIWAGEVHDAFIRVLADNLSSQLSLDRVWSFPWDNRNRPEYQLRIIVEQFSGKLGDKVTLRAKWSLLGGFGREELMTRRSRLEKAVDGRGYGSYVSALNDLLADFSLELAQHITTGLGAEIVAETGQISPESKPDSAPAH